MEAKDVVDKLVPIYEQINSLDDDAKVILKEAKDAGLASTMLGKIAKAKADQKIGELFDKTEELLNLVEPFVND